MAEMQHEMAELQGMTTHELAARYQEVWGRPPRVKHRRFLVKRILWKLEEARTGGLSKKARERLEELIADLDIDLGARTASGTLTPRRSSRKGSQLPPGTTIRRPWKGRDVIVRVLDDGFEYEGEVYRSLSAIAKHVTASHLSGPRFFGLRARKSG